MRGRAHVAYERPWTFSMTLCLLGIFLAITGRVRACSTAVIPSLTNRVMSRHTNTALPSECSRGVFFFLTRVFCEHQARSRLHHSVAPDGSTNHLFDRLTATMIAIANSPSTTREAGCPFKAPVLSLDHGMTRAALHTSNA